MVNLRSLQLTLSATGSEFRFVLDHGFPQGDYPVFRGILLWIGIMEIISFPSFPGINSSSELSPGPSFCWSFWVFYVFFCCLDISGSHFSTVPYRVVFCDMVRQIFLFLFLEYVEMVLSDSIFDPIKSHVDCLEIFFVLPFRWLCCLPLYGRYH